MYGVLRTPLRKSTLPLPSSCPKTVPVRFQEETTTHSILYQTILLTGTHSPLHYFRELYFLLWSVWVMKLPRSAWTWSAFQVDTALFMYGGVSTVAIPVEAITTPAPKVKEPRPLQRSKSKRKSLKRSLSKIFWSGNSLSSLSTILAHRYEFTRTWGDWGPGGCIDQNHRRKNSNHAYYRAPTMFHYIFAWGSQSGVWSIDRCKAMLAFLSSYKSDYLIRTTHLRNKERQSEKSTERPGKHGPIRELPNR